MAPRGRGSGWRGGRGRGRGRGHGSGTSRGRDSDHASSPRRPKRVCPHFLAGRCTYGSSCKFSHDEQDVARARAEELSSEATPGEAQQARDDYFDFKRQMRHHGLGIFLSDFDASECVEMWTLTLGIMNSSNRELHQSVARDLADDDIGGPGFITRTVRLCGTLKSDGDCLSVARAFLQTITHPSLLRCLSVDTFVGTIYRMVSGGNGDQGISFFSNLNRRLSEATESPQQSLALVILSLYELVCRERKCLLNDDMPALLKELETKAVQLDTWSTNAAGTISDFDTFTVQIDMMRRMLDGARGRLATNDLAGVASTTRNANTIQSTFPTAVTVPGGNHDNDSADITKIQIFPTLGEIMSDAAEYLPSTDFTRPHFLADPVQRHLDASFRLLRHDIFGPFKEAIGALLAQPNGANTLSTSRLHTGNIRAHTYTRASIQHVLINSDLEASLSFAQPPQLRKHSLPDQRRWWEESRRLEQGGLVCFVSARGDERGFLLFVVTKKNTKEEGEDHNQSNLVSAHSNPSVTVKLVSGTQQNMVMLNRMFVEKQEGLLIELPGLIPETFVPVLENLQRMRRDEDLAFRRWILPRTDASGSSHGPTIIPPPAYARHPGFRFRLQSITRSGQPTLSINPSEPGAIDPATLEAATGLDRGQSNSLTAALTREYALIQGPPGTGKSYVGVQLVRVLLDHKDEGKIGPILVICYTNHALDQFLKHLLDVGIEKIIRIGGQSRSEELEGKNLRVVSRDTAKTTVEHRILGQNYSGVDQCLQDAGNSLKPLHQARKARLTWSTLRPFLSRKYPKIARQFQVQEQDEFQLVGGNPLQVWLGKMPHPSTWAEGQLDLPEIILRAQLDINSLSQGERWALAESWRLRMTQVQSEQIFELIDQAKKHRERIHGVHDDVSRRTLLHADVVGVTTTGLARNIKMLRHLGAKVIIAEEAAEVMEPHLISALMRGVEHFIQIGDHRQLRPQIQNYLQFSLETAAGRAHQLDRSQFERRAVGEPGLPALPLAQLNVQRRMRPEISQLIRRVYPNLQDHDCVQNLPSVVGMRDNLFWLDHDYPEDGKDDGTQVKSHSNPWEVTMAAALVRHLVRQGEYKTTDIALLTPYTGQLQKLRAALSKDFEVFLSDRDLETLAKEGFEVNTGEEEKAVVAGPRRAVEKKQLLQTIRLATVDNFQGEEAKVIIVSLVRSNSKSKVGFLRTENRINVLLSRAQHGMYLIGNTKTYLNVPMWADVHQQLQEREAVGTSIALCCPRHPDTPILCSGPLDFTLKSPEGGCSLLCDERLDSCGHRCPAPCHSKRLHDAFDCLQPCPRLRSTCQHPCPKLCGQHCGPCNVKVSGVKLPCGHVHNKVACYETLDLASIKCSHPVEKQVPGCGHTVTVACFKDVTSKLFLCPTKCTELFKCSHRCPGTCGRCRKQDDDGGVKFVHQGCDKPCDRPYGTCNHRCSRACHGGTPCGMCSEKCEVRCPHSRCNQNCQQPCAPCIEKCTWFCEHKGSCSLPCAAPCDRLPCDERCTRVLRCGHQCPSFCGEECPQDLCQTCCARKDARVDLMEFKAYEEIDLNETPIAVLGCGHFFTGETLDGLVGMSSVYTTDNVGNFSGLQQLSGELTAVPTCPDCRVPIRQFSTRRYNRVVNKAVLDETSKRFLVGGREKVAELEKLVADAEKELANSRKTLNPNKATQHRYIPIRKLELEAVKLRKAMDTEHQPTKKLFDAVLTFQRLNQKNGSLESHMDNLTLTEPNTTPSPRPTVPPPVYDQQVTLGAFHLHLRIQDAMLRDVYTLQSKHGNSPLPTLLPGNPLDKRSARFLQQCKTLITSATAAKLPRLVIPTMLAYARIAQLEGWYQRTITPAITTTTTTTTEPPPPPPVVPNEQPNQPTEDTASTARTLLAQALALCDTFPGGKDYRAEVEETMRLFAGPRYESVTPDEIAAVKAAMVSGAGGLATHSGHWYTCRNGHPFAIGECGMPMEQARCPECGEPIGGQNHMVMEGTARDMRMERD